MNIFEILAKFFMSIYLPTLQEVGHIGRASPWQESLLCGASVQSKLASGFLGLGRCPVV